MKKILGLFFLLGSLWAQGLHQKDAHHWWLAYDNHPPYQISQLGNPPRCILDLKHTRLSGKSPAGIRMAAHGKDWRLVFDHCTQLSVHREKSRLLITTNTLPHLKAKPHPKDWSIVLDPGHGGHDSGARGRYGLLEKNVVLAIAQKLAALLSQQPHVHVTLTRNKDIYLPLRTRLDRARRAHADLFIAIHADAFIHSRAHGASVYALSERGASSEAARWLAAKDNYDELGGIELEGKSALLRSVLIDLSQTATIGRSLSLGTELLKQLQGVANLHRHFVEQARFVVLKSPDIPSILVETGFISNPNEASRLRNVHYQQRLAIALSHGILSYMATHPKNLS